MFEFGIQIRGVSVNLCVRDACSPSFVIQALQQPVPLIEISAADGNLNLFFTFLPHD
jgi:hypothetical protein